MNNFACVCVNIYSQLSQLLQSFQANSLRDTSTFTHDGGFGDNPMRNDPGSGLGTPGRFSDGNDSVFTFAVILMILALFFLGTNNQRAGERINAEEKVPRGNR